MPTHENIECCPRFNPEPWDDKVIIWQGKRFVQDRVSSFFHLPMNFDVIMKKNDSAIRAADAYAESKIVLTDENSAWGANVYFEVSKDIPNAKMVTLSGTFLSKVFEGSYREICIWVEEMKAYVAAKNKHLRKMYFYYTTCPECAKKYGKNYIVILAEIDAGLADNSLPN